MVESLSSSSMGMSGKDLVKVKFADENGSRSADSSLSLRTTDALPPHDVSDASSPATVPRTLSRRSSRAEMGVVQRVLDGKIHASAQLTGRYRRRHLWSLRKVFAEPDVEEAYVHNNKDKMFEEIQIGIAPSLLHPPLNPAHPSQRAGVTESNVSSGQCSCSPQDSTSP